MEKTDHSILINAILREMESQNLTRYLDAVIISGSFGRGEPTCHVAENQIVYDSDMEMAVVYTSLMDMLLFKKKSRKVIERFPQIDLELMPISAGRLRYKRNHNFSLVSPKYKTLFNYDFYHGSKTVWGKDYLQAEVSLDCVDRYEGKRLIANRVAELEYNRAHGKKQSEIERWIAKIILAIGSACLLENQKYQSSYRRQLESLREYKGIAEEILPEGFFEDYQWAFDYLRDKKPTAYAKDESVIRTYIKAMYTYYSDKGIDRPRTGCLYIALREGIKLLKFDFKYIRFCLNPRELIFNSIMKSYYSKSLDVSFWANAWKEVLN